MLNLLLGFVLGILASMIASLVIEELRGPAFSITTDPGNVERTRNPSIGPFAFFRAEVTPTPPLRVKGRGVLGSRRTPRSVTAYVTVTDPLRHNPTFQRVPARWPAWPAPMATQFLTDQGTGNLVRIDRFDDAEAARQRVLDFAGPRDSQPLDVFLKIEGREEIYFYNNDNYRHGMDYAAHALPYGDYHVEVIVECEGRITRQWFSLSNRGSSWRDVRFQRLGR